MAVISGWWPLGRGVNMTGPGLFIMFSPTTTPTRPTKLKRINTESVQYTHLIPNLAYSSRTQQ